MNRIARTMCERDGCEQEANFLIIGVLVLRLGNLNSEKVVFDRPRLVCDRCRSELLVMLERNAKEI